MAAIQLPYYLSLPSAEPPFPGVLVVHEGNGMSAQLLRFCERLAAEGYAACAPDFFFRSGGPEAADFAELIGSITPDAAEGRPRHRHRAPAGRRRVVDRRHRLLHGRLVHVPRRTLGRRTSGCRRRCRSTAVGSRARSPIPAARRSSSSEAATSTSPRRTSRRSASITATTSSCTRTPSTASCATVRRTTTRTPPPTRGSACSRFFGEHLS